jgi:hypothetical protein
VPQAPREYTAAGPRGPDKFSTGLLAGRCVYRWGRKHLPLLPREAALEKVVKSWKQSCRLSRNGARWGRRRKHSTGHGKVLVRGDYKHLPVKDAPKGFPLILGRRAARITKGSGRLELANWLAPPDHLFTSRVFVNRVWYWHFGGWCARPDNWKRMNLVSHPICFCCRINLWKAVGRSRRFIG